MIVMYHDDGDLDGDSQQLEWILEMVICIGDLWWFIHE